MALSVRAATAEDADAVASLGREFVEYLRAFGDPAPRGIAATEYLRDGFGKRRAFSGFIAESDGGIVGYLLYHDGYDIDRGGRVLHVIDLFVSAAARHEGTGRALMEKAADECRRLGGHALVWSVYPPNAAARAFYERLGATYSGDLLMSLPL